MKLFSALVKKKDGKIENITLLEEGFSWTVFFFSTLWFLFHKMWRFAAIVFAIDIAFKILSEANFLPNLNLAVIETFFSIALAFNSSHFFYLHLKSLGYQKLTMLLAPNKSAAKIKLVSILKEENPEMTFEDFGATIFDVKDFVHFVRKPKEPYFIV